ncbi:unnamed protein product [Camellia sinensis]
MLCNFCNPFTNYNEDENFESEQGGRSNNDPANLVVQESSNYPNYQSYMKKTPRSRWSKQHTKLFYEVNLAVVSNFIYSITGETSFCISI